MTERPWLATALLLAGCAAAVDTPKLPRMGVDVAFGPNSRCRGVSPEIRLTNVPRGTVSYEVRLTDLDVPSFHHWAQTLPATGPVIRENSGSGYHGPCPPSGTHRYQISVTARDGATKPVAYGEKTVAVGR